MYRFVSQHIRPLVRRKMAEENWTQGQVADWLSVPQSALSEYVNGRCLPPEHRLARLARLDGDRAALLEAIRCDRFGAWLDTQEVSARAALRILYRIEAERVS